MVKVSLRLGYSHYTTEEEPNSPPAPSAAATETMAFVTYENIGTCQPIFPMAVE
jgi:hypothetical protein